DDEEGNAQRVPRARLALALFLSAGGQVLALRGREHVKPEALAEQLDVRIAPHQSARDETPQQPAIPSVDQAVLGELKQQHLFVLVAVRPEIGERAETYFAGLW